MGNRKVGHPLSGRALLLVLAAAVAHAGWNALAKRARDPIVFLWSSVALASAGLMPLGIWALTLEGWVRGGALFVLASVGIHAVYFYALGRAYGAGDLSLVYPVARGLGVALVPVVAFLFLDERLSPLGVVGIALVVAGIAGMQARAGSPSTSSPPPAGKKGLATGLGWAILTGLSIAAYSVVDKAGVARVHPLVYISAMGVGMTLLLLPLVLRRRESLLREWRDNGRAIALASTMNLTSYLLVLFAFRLSKAGYVVAARETSIVLSVLIGALLMREGHVAPRLAGAAVVLGGVACVALTR
jgi:drug/metabolite transporter (DMT)-like permease